jgi:multiple antibiotic resistance protein
MSIFAVAFSLFLVMNAIGNIPLFVAMLVRYDVKKQRQIIIRELLIALGILLIFCFFGDNVLNALNITRPIIGIAGGTLLFLISLGMIFPKNSHDAESLAHEPMIVPLAMPIIAGPGAITTVMIYSQLYSAFFMIGAIFLAWIPSVILLLLASNIRYLLGEKGLMACKKFGGMLVSLIAVHMVTSGIINLIKDNFQGAT